MKNAILILLLSILFSSCNNKADILFEQGNLKNANKDFVGAIGDFDKAIEIDSNHVKSIVGRGISKSNLLDFAGAIEDYSLAIKKDPAFGASFYYRGFAKMMMGK
jgi:tetratricopeptide (TPR) repeat protein